MTRDAKASDSILAYTLPFVIYVVPTMFESANGLGLSYEFICTMKGVFSAIAIWVFRRAYPVFSAAGLRLAIMGGFLGIVLWVILDRLQSNIPGIPLLPSWLLPGRRTGYNPWSNGTPSLIQIAFIFVRLIELAIIVPVVEEIFWRGFLSRYLIAEDFQTVVPGTFTKFSFIFVTIAFASVHPEVLAAIVWSLLINLLYGRTRNLWACIVMHSVTNGLLGAYVLTTKSWNLW